MVTRPCEPGMGSTRHRQAIRLCRRGWEARYLTCSLHQRRRTTNAQNTCEVQRESRSSSLTTAGPAQWVEVGRAYERFALQSAALEIRNALLNQPVEVPTLRPQFAALLGIGKHRPDLIVRFGRGPKLPPSLRRPLQTVLV